jgi:hypothetical protein
MTEAFTYQVSDLDHFVTDTGYAYADADDIDELAIQLEGLLLSEQPGLNNMGLVLVIGDAKGKPLHFRPLGVIH